VERPSGSDLVVAAPAELGAPLVTRLMFVPVKLVSRRLAPRLAARLFTFSERASAAAAGGSPLDGMQRSPLTLGLFLLLAGYYVTYYAGVIRKAGRAPRGASG